MSEQPVHTPQQAAMRRLHEMIEHFGPAGISDIHVHPGKRVRVLPISGDGLKQIDTSFSQEDIDAWLALATGGRPNPLEARGHVSAALPTPNYRVRATFRRSLQGRTSTFRIIPSTVPEMADIGVVEGDGLADLIDHHSGLVLVQGPTGSGKTTLIASLLKEINRRYSKHIYTVEDPIEFVHTEEGHSSIIQREIGTHARDYPTAIEDALRSKPNVIMVGELLNPETTKAALHAATTGHLVFTTAHAGSVTEALDGFVGQFTADEQPQIRIRLSQSLLAVVVQTLVPTVKGGKIAAREVMFNNADFAELIRKEQSQMIRPQLVSQRGCNTLEQSLSALVAHGHITPETARAFAKDKADMNNELSRMKLRVA